MPAPSFRPLRARGAAPGPAGGVVRPYPGPQYQAVNPPALSGNSLPGPRHMLVGVYALMLTVPIAEIIIVYLHIHIPVVVIVDLLLTVLLILSGAVGRFMRTPMAAPWLAALVLYAIAAALGIYKGESVPFIAAYGVRFHVVPIYFCALLLKPAHVRHVMRWIGWGMLLLVLLCLKFGTSEGGRFFLPDTSLQNPNDLAFAFLFGASCLLLNSSLAMRLVALATCPAILFFVLK